MSVQKAKIKIHKQDSLNKVKAYMPYALFLAAVIVISLILVFSYPKLKSSFNKFLSNNLNLKVQNIYIDGIENVDVADLSEIININKGDPIFKVKTQQLRYELENMPWVRLAQVQRILPSSIKISLFEHKPIATIKFNDKRWALNAKGELIDLVDENFSYLLELSGKAAKTNAAGLFSLFADWTELLFSVKNAEFIGQRRWNLYLDNGTLIMLPEENVRYSLKILKILDNQQRVLKKEKIKIDLRNIHKNIIIDEQKSIY